MIVPPFIRLLSLVGPSNVLVRLGPDELSNPTRIPPWEIQMSVSVGLDSILGVAHVDNHEGYKKDSEVDGGHDELEMVLVFVFVTSYVLLRSSLITYRVESRWLPWLRGNTDTLGARFCHDDIMIDYVGIGRVKKYEGVIKSWLGVTE